MRKFFGLSSSHKKQYTFNPALDSLKGPGPFGGSAGSPGGFVIPSMHPYGQHYATGESGFAPPPYFPNDPSLVDSSSGGIVFPLPGNIHSSNSNEFTRRTPQYYQTPMRKESVEDALRMLQRYNTILLVDDSASMGQDNLWQQTEMAFEKLAEIAKFYDKDGIEVYFFSSEIHGKNLKEFAEIQGLFRSVTPNADYTAMGEKLDKILRVYLAELELAHSKDPVNFGGIKPVNIIVITDGVASDDPESPIAQAAGRLDKLNFPMDQVNIILRRDKVNK
ncbi:hypothetical protein DXG01_006670 [Tephrocybe rancida]|nr:hypothetical protein DXG01_006670 [Tephrocybe rancida]